MRIVRRLLLLFAVLLGLAAGWLIWLAQAHPSLADYESFTLPAPDPRDWDRGKLRVTFLGVSSLLFDDGETAIMTDGFFSRPGKLQVLFSRLAPQRDAIDRGLQRAGIGRLAAVVVVHSHYDHAMDAPAVAQRTGALLVGSSSTANIGRGWGLSEDRIRVVGHQSVLRFGRFTIRMLEARHFPSGLAEGDIAAPLRPPAHALAFRQGGSYSVLIEHDSRTMLVHASAGFLPGAMDEWQAEVVFLGIAGLGRRGPAYRDAYWRSVVAPLQPRRIVPIHWDDFTLPLERPVQPLPLLLDNIPVALDFLFARSRQAGVDFRLPVAWRKSDPFAGLPE